MEAKDEFHHRWLVEASPVLLKVVEYRVDGDASVEGDGYAQLRDPRRFGVGQEEVALAHLDGADAALVGSPRRPAVLETKHHQRAVVLREVLYCGVVACMRSAHEVEGCAPVVCFLDGFGEDYAGGTDGGRSGECDSEASDNYQLLEPLKIAIVRFGVDGSEGVVRLLEHGDDIREFGHGSEWGGDRGGGRPVFVLMSDL